MNQSAGEARDSRAGERDRRADRRDRRAARRDRRAAGGTDDQAALGRALAASDRAAAADDRTEAARDRHIAACERGDADEEREILQRDGLTGVLQRDAGLVALQREAARSARSDEPFLVAFIDVDGLKRINDDLGHGCGDDVLRTLGEKLRAGMRPYDLAVRYGGDEFICILPGMGFDEARTRFGVLQTQLGSGDLPVSITFGLSEWRAGEDTEALVARADSALYEKRRARRAGDQNSRRPESVAVRQRTT